MKDVFKSFFAGAAAVLGGLAALYLMYSLYTTKFVVITFPKIFY